MLDQLIRFVGPGGALRCIALLALSLFAFQSLAASAEPCSQNCYPAGDTWTTTSSGGLTRRFLVHVPTSYNASRPAQLILGLHGSGSSVQEEIDYSGLVQLSDQQGFILILPEGYNADWNGSNCCGATDHDDVAFLRAVISEVKGRTNINDGRVFMIGHSGGGAMAHRFACEAADVVKAIVAVSHRLSTPEQCHPSRPVTVLEIDGLLDPLVDYFGVNSLGFVSARTSFANWATIDQCQGDVARGRITNNGQMPLIAPTIYPAPVNLPTQVSRSETFLNCAGGARVSLVTIVTGTHTADTNLEGFRSTPYAWNFLQALP